MDCIVLGGLVADRYFDIESFPERFPLPVLPHRIIGMESIRREVHGMVERLAGQLQDQGLMGTFGQSARFGIPISIRFQYFRGIFLV